jgi:hypothetical protein
MVGGRAVERHAGLLVALLGAILAHPVCNFTFRCGCELFLLARRCNIHQARGPHCPWCAHPPLFLLAAACAGAAALGSMHLSRRLLGRRALSTVGAGLSALLFTAVVVGRMTSFVLR